MSSLKSQEPPHAHPPSFYPNIALLYVLCWNSSKSSLLEFLPKSNSSPFQFSVSVISFACLMSMSPLLSVQSVQTESEHFAIEVSVPLLTLKKRCLSPANTNSNLKRK